jgi:hypothetical protein
MSFLYWKIAPLYVFIINKFGYKCRIRVDGFISFILTPWSERLGFIFENVNFNNKIIQKKIPIFLIDILINIFYIIFWFVLSVIVSYLYFVYLFPVIYR